MANAATTAKSGYLFPAADFVAVAGGGININYVVYGGPAAVNQGGVRGFCSSSDGIIRFNNPAAAVNTVAACAALTALQ